MGWIRDEGSAAIGHNLARQEIYPRRAKAVISDVRGRYAAAVALQHGRDGAGTAAWFPYSSSKLHVTKQRLGDPIGRRIEVVDFTIIAGDMDGAADVAPENSIGLGCTGLRHIAQRKQVTHGLGGFIKHSLVLVMAAPSGYITAAPAMTVLVNRYQQRVEIAPAQSRNPLEKSLHDLVTASK